MGCFAECGFSLGDGDLFHWNNKKITDMISTSVFGQLQSQDIFA
jgi:hypothetical protein